jgi:hypothetical protein
MGQSFDNVIPGFTQPISDWTEIPIAHERAQIHINERTTATYGVGSQRLRIRLTQLPSREPADDVIGESRLEPSHAQILHQSRIRTGEVR